MIMEKEKVLVAGASGYLGRYAVHEFKKRGYFVRALVRNPEKAGKEGPNLEPSITNVADEIVTGDATKPETLKDVCKNIDVVFSAMGLTMPEGNATNYDIDYLGNKAILDDALSHGVRKFIYVSVFNASKMSDVDVVKAHELFVETLTSSNMDYAIIRPTGYFSDMGMFFSMVKSGHMFLLGDGENKVNPIHGADLAKVCVDAVENHEKEVGTGGPEVFTFNEVISMAFDAVGKKPWITHIPLWMGDAALFITGFFSKTLAGLLSFAITVNRIDNVAPMSGTHYLKDFYRELAKKAG